jgi:hypothetical protein
MATSNKLIIISKILNIIIIQIMIINKVFFVTTNLTKKMFYTNNKIKESFLRDFTRINKKTKMHQIYFILKIIINFTIKIINIKLINITTILINNKIMMISYILRKKIIITTINKIKIYRKMNRLINHMGIKMINILIKMT